MGNCGNCLPFLFHSPDGLLLRWRDFLPDTRLAAAPSLAVCTGNGLAGGDPLAPNFGFELGNRCQDVRHETAGGGR